MLAEAAERAGLDDFGDDWFLTPLERFAEDLDHGVLNDRGRAVLREQAIRDLVRRLRVVDFLRRHPETDDVEIPPIVYVTGQARSGTTLLHNVLARHAQARPLLRWELMDPLPPPEAATHATDPRIARVQAAIDKRRGTLLERMHWVNAGEPEECQWAFIDLVSILAGAAAFCMPRWGDFLATADLTPVYENYRRIVQLLLWRNPVASDGFLVLKAPQISSAIDAFAAVFPEARFLVPLRDPYRVVVSVRTMIDDVVAALVDPDRCSAAAITDDVLRSVERSVAALARYDETAPTPPLLVPYPAVVADTVTTAVGVYETLGVPPDPALPAAIEGFLGAQRAGARAAPPATLPDWGLDHDDVLRRPVFGDACTRWGIEPERSRRTGSHP
jgi:hypothetical protein